MKKIIIHKIKEKESNSEKIAATSITTIFFTLIAVLFNVTICFPLYQVGVETGTTKYTNTAIYIITTASIIILTIIACNTYQETPINIETEVEHKIITK